MQDLLPIVPYNGAKFDTPYLQREFALLGLPLPAPFKQIDSSSRVVELEHLGGRFPVAGDVGVVLAGGDPGSSTGRP